MGTVCVSQQVLGELAGQDLEISKGPRKDSLNKKVGDALSLGQRNRPGMPGGRDLIGWDRVQCTEEEQRADMAPTVN